MNREKTIIRTSILGIVANAVLVFFKATIGFVVGSIAIINDAINNLTDALSSLITIIGTKLSNKKADKKHPFGHGRVEYITSTVIALLILIAGIGAIYESINSIIAYFKEGTKADYSVVSLIIIGVAVIIKIVVGLIFKKQGKKVESDALVASGTDALGDAILSSATLVGAIFSFAFGWYVEGYLGIIIGAFIIKAGIEVLRESISSIIGERYDDAEAKAIIEDINNVEGVKGTFDLILNSYGHHRNIGSVHILVDGELKAKDIQTIERNIMLLMFTKYHTIMTVGIYADNEETAESKKIMDSLLNIIKEYPNILQMHGFYLDVVNKVCNFDLVISFDEKEPEKLIDFIKSELEYENEGYKIFITLDRDYTLS